MSESSGLVGVDGEMAIDVSVTTDVRRSREDTEGARRRLCGSRGGVAGLLALVASSTIIAIPDPWATEADSATSPIAFSRQYGSRRRAITLAEARAKALATVRAAKARRQRLVEEEAHREAAWE